MSRHLMLVPSLACPASCAYCFGPHEGGPPMERDTLRAVVRWQGRRDGDDPLEVTFHGGEPLVPGDAFYRDALPLLREGLAPRRVRFSVQSNLWLLTDGLCDLFREYSVSLGTSLDGPESINDAQRGEGHFRRTMAGIERAREQGLSVGCICTFTERSAPRADDIFDFFVGEGLDFTVHAAVPSPRYPQADDWAVSPQSYGRLMVDMVERYLGNVDCVRIDMLDALCRSVSTRNGSVCTFDDCLGGYLAVGPRGWIYPCQRFAGMKAYRLGNVHDLTSTANLSASPVWQGLRARQERADEACEGCPYHSFCRGGCPYNVIAANGGSLANEPRDPYCPAYRRIFGHIVDRAMEEVFSDENLRAVVDRPDPKVGLLRRGRLLSVMGDGPHPHEVAQRARRILAAVALAVTESPVQAAIRFRRLELPDGGDRTEAGFRALHRRLVAPRTRLNNLYLHVTFACPLRCTHCYAQAGPGRDGALPVTDIVRASRDAADLGFRHAVITGGEPLVHPRRDALLDELSDVRQEIKPLLTVLRTSLALPMRDDLLRRVGRSTDEVVVSVDGDRETHDARRGAGSYDLTVCNLRALVEMGYQTDLSLATVLPLCHVDGKEGDAVRALASDLGIRRIRFRPVLPLGRAAEAPPDVVPETLWGHVHPDDVVAYGFTPVASCGIGENLYVEPDGGAYPCYAWRGERWLLGDVRLSGGLSGLIGTPAFRDLSRHTVDTNCRCKRCALRYLCGGACRAWNRLPEREQTDLDAPPLDCNVLHSRARSLLRSALKHLEVSTETWLAAGLPLPEAPPEFIL
ncbi:MAG: TIGR04083 family peptide-modifying radical SAM enzyme [Anaerolineae bacterium]|jgi:uncharacterized protein